MDSWHVGFAGPDRHPRDAALDGFVGLIGCIGGERFADRALGALNASVQAASWSVYQVWRGTARPPVLHLSASRGVPDTTQDCFSAYRDGLYRRDRSFDRVDAAPPGHAAVLRMNAEEAPNSDHRDIIYRRHGVAERLSVAQLESDGSLLAVNLYHHVHQGRFSAGELQSFSAIAPLLVAAVRRHIALDGAVARRDTSPRDALARHCPALTPRELDVCERLLRGWSYDGVAADMQLSVATVKTYRARAFDRLGIHFRSELFARFASPTASPAAVTVNLSADA